MPSQTVPSRKANGCTHMLSVAPNDNAKMQMLSMYYQVYHVHHCMFNMMACYFLLKAAVSFTFSLKQVLKSSIFHK